MLLFLDTEYTDALDCELISIGMVSEDGQHELYLEIQDFDRAKCNSFVQSAVWAHLGQFPQSVVRKDAIKAKLVDWFSTLPRNVTIACDSFSDWELLLDAMEGERPENLVGRYDLRALIDTTVFNHAATRFHNSQRPWHHALFDAQAHRAGWLAWADENKSRRSHNTGKRP